MYGAPTPENETFNLATLVIKHFSKRTANVTVSVIEDCKLLILTCPYQLMYLVN